MKKNNLDIGVAAVLIIFTLFFKDSINGIILFNIGLVCWIIIYYLNKKNDIRIEIILIRMLILSLPLSFLNIFGNSYGEFPLSWFNSFFIFISIYTILLLLKSNRLVLNKLLYISMLLLALGLIPLISSIEIVSGLKQYINIFLSLFLLFIATNLKSNINKKHILDLSYIYVKTTEVVAICILLQIAIYNILGRTIGTISFYGGGRTVYLFLFSDASFLSLFLISGAIMIYFQKRNKNNLGFVQYFEMFILILSSILTSARTGIFAFLVVFCIYSFFKFFVYLHRGSVNAILLMLLNLTVIVVSAYFLIQVREIGLFSDSGRSEVNTVAFNVFLENPIFGIGFGIDNYVKYTESTIPHNLLIQFLAQGGLLFTIPLIVFFLTLIYFTYKRDKSFLPVILCMIVGALLIPDIFNSRFFPVLLLVLSFKD